MNIEEIKAECLLYVGGKTQKVDLPTLTETFDFLIYKHNQETERLKAELNELKEKHKKKFCICKNRQDQFKKNGTWICGDCELEIKQKFESND